MKKAMIGMGAIIIIVVFALYCMYAIVSNTLSSNHQMIGQVVEITENSLGEKVLIVEDNQGNRYVVTE